MTTPTWDNPRNAELCGTATDKEGVRWGKYFARRYCGRPDAAPTYYYVNLDTGKEANNGPQTSTIKTRNRSAKVINGRLIPADTITETVWRSIRFKRVPCFCGSGRPIDLCSTDH